MQGKIKYTNVLLWPGVSTELERICAMHSEGGKVPSVIQDKMRAPGDSL